MKDLFVRTSPQLRRRIAIAAAFDSVHPALYSRRILERWLNYEGEGRRPTLQPVDNERGPYISYRYRVSDSAHRFARVIAAGWDMSVSSLVIRVLDNYTPHEVEALAAAFAAP